MGLNHRAIIRITGFLLVVFSALLSLPLLTSLIYRETDCMAAFLLTIVPCLGAGASILFFLPRKRSHTTLQKRDAFLIVSCFWLLMSVLGAIPFLLQGCISNFPDAFFESCSGFSTTGASILTNVEMLPRSMLFWRSFTHWIGGMGILVFAVALLPSLGLAGQTIVKSESPGPVLSKITPKMSDMAKSLYLIYLAMTLIETFLLLLGGMNLFDALVYSFGTMGTGGFSTYNAGIAFFHSPYIEGVITVFMLLAGMNFNLHYLAITGQPMIYARDMECRNYLLIVALATGFITINLALSHTTSSILSGFRYAVFQVASIITTTGYASADFNLWPTFSLMTLFLLFFIGGCSSSTAGGIKVVRVTVLLKMIRRFLILKIHPNATLQIKANHHAVPSDTMQEICSYTFLFIVSVLATGTIIAIDGQDLVTNFSAAASCIGNIGPGFNSVGPAANYSLFSGPSTVILALAMIAGRLELFTFFMILSPRFWNPAR